MRADVSELKTPGIVFGNTLLFNIVNILQQFTEEVSAAQLGRTEGASMLTLLLDS